MTERDDPRTDDPRKDDSMTDDEAAAARTPSTHQIKLWPEFYEAVMDGRKTFEIRRDDRDGGFHVGDYLILREWDPADAKRGYTGKQTSRRVSYVLSGGQFGVEEGFVVMGLEVSRAEEERQ